MKRLLIATACAVALSACAHKGDDMEMEMEETMMEEEAMMEEEMMEEEMMEEVDAAAVYCAESGGTVIYDGVFDGEVCRMADGWQMELEPFYTYGVGATLNEGALDPAPETIRSYGG